MTRKLAAILSILPVCLCLLLILACTPEAEIPAEQPTLNIGCIMPFTGPAALWGQNIRPGMEIYADLINEDGGLQIGDKRYKIEMIFKDGFAPGPAATATRNLVYDSGVKAIVGYFGLGIAAMTQITNPEKVILNIGTIGGLDPSPPEKSYVMYGFPSMEITIYQAIAAMQAFPQYHTMAWTGPSSGEHNIDATFGATDEKLQKEFGIKSVRMYYPEGTLNFTPYLTKMAEQGTEVIYCVGSPLEVGLMAKQRWQMGYKWPICQIASALDLDIMKGIGGSEEAVQNIVSDYPVPWALKKVTVAPKYVDMAKRISDRYKELYEKEIFLGAYGGSAINSQGQYFEALEQAGTTDPDVVMRTLRGGTFDTFLGRYKLTGKRFYGSDVVFGHPCAMGISKGRENIYLGEYPLTNIDIPFAEFESSQ
ncbi:MAG: ABC transporter substrate-binding protein [Dehalococcoidia bacterium]|nr:ABC transporter substrate-binding protein [Dehalococcoidia bacterium]